MSLLQGAEEGKEASVRGRLGQKLLDLQKEKKYTYIIILKSYCYLVNVNKGNFVCRRE